MVSATQGKLMKHILIIVVSCFSLVAPIAQAKVIFAEGSGVTEDAAKNAALTQLSEQVEVSVDAATFSSEAVTDDQFSSKFMQYTSVSTSATLQNVKYTMLSSSPLYRVKVSIDLEVSYRSQVSRLKELSAFLAQLVKSPGNVNVLRELMKSAQRYQSAYDQVVILHSMLGQEQALPANYLTANTAVLNKKFAELDELIKLTATAHGKIGADESKLVNQVLSMLSQQMGVAVKSSSSSEDTLVNDEFNSTFSEQTELSTESELLGVTFSKAVDGDTVAMTAVLEPRRALPLYINKIADYIISKRQNYRYPIAMEFIPDIDKELDDLAGVIRTASDLAAMVGTESILSSQDQSLLLLWRSYISLSNAYWLDYEYQSLDEVAEFVNYQYGRNSSFEVCRSENQQATLNFNDLLNRVNSGGSQNKSEVKPLVWFTLSEGEKTFLVLRSPKDNNSNEFKINIAPTLLSLDNVLPPEANRVLIKVQVADSDFNSLGQEAFDSELASYLEDSFGSDVVLEDPCLPTTTLDDKALQQVYDVSYFVEVTATPVIGKSNFGDARFAKVDLSWEVTSLNGKQNKSYTFKNQGRKFPINDVETGIQAAFKDGLTKGKKKLQKKIIP